MLISLNSEAFLEGVAKEVKYLTCFTPTLRTFLSVIEHDTRGQYEAASITHHFGLDQSQTQTTQPVSVPVQQLSESPRVVFKL